MDSVLQDCSSSCQLHKSKIEELEALKETKETVAILTNRFNVFSEVETVEQM